MNPGGDITRCGAVLPRCVELDLHLSGGAALHLLVRERQAGDKAAQLLQLFAVMRFAALACKLEPSILTTPRRVSGNQAA